MGIQCTKKTYTCTKHIQPSDEQVQIKKAARFEADQLLHLAIQAATESIANIIDKVAEEYNRSFNGISSLVHLGGTVLKQ